MESMASKLSTMKANVKKFTDKVTDGGTLDRKENNAELSMNHVANSSRHVKTGWLRKQGGMVKSWHRRWFVLNGDCLFYFAKEDDLRPLGTIYLPGNKIIQHPSNPDEPDKFLLEIVPGKVPQKMAPNHDSFLLCAASDDERQEWIKAIRKTMFSSIGGAVFGSPLEETMMFEKTRSDRKVPYIVEACVEFLTLNGLEVEGLFRLPGRMLIVRDLKDKFDEGEQVDLDKEDADVHSVASLLKQYLRELPECLIPFNLYQEYMNIAMRFQENSKNESRLQHVGVLRNAMSGLPQDNYNLLKYLCNFLHKVAAKTNINKMSALNLATVFGPNIIRHPNMDDNPEQFMLATADISQQLAYMFINYFEQVFTLGYDSGRKSVAVPVDDLLCLGDEMSADGVLEPDKPDAAPRSNAINELSDIVFEQRADRRARSFQFNTQLTFRDDDNDTISVAKSDLRLDLDKRETTSETLVLSSPKSAESSPVCGREKLLFDANGRPIPPIRNKYRRSNKKKRLPKTNSFESVPSEDSGSEKSSSVDDSPIETVDSTQNTMVMDLQHRLENMTAQYDSLQCKYDALVTAKAKSDDHVKVLTTEMGRIQNRYEEHIRALEARNKAQLDDMARKLDLERTSQADAVQKVVDLQKVIHNYKMQYGELADKQLPPLYR